MKPMLDTAMAHNRTEQQDDYLLNCTPLVLADNWFAPPDDVVDNFIQAWLVVNSQINQSNAVHTKIIQLFSFTIFVKHAARNRRSFNYEKTRRGIAGSRNMATLQTVW
jgi:hypothetical protein